MSQLEDEYIRHDVFGRTYTLADGNHICVNIITETTELPNGYDRPENIEKVWFMELTDGKVVYTGQTCDEETIIEKDVSIFPNSLVEDVENEYNVTVVTNISEEDIDIPKKPLTIDITDEELNELSEMKLAEYLYFDDVKPSDGHKRINKFSNDSYGYTLEDTATGRKMTIAKYGQSFKIKLFDKNNEKINMGDFNKYTPSEVSGVLDDYRTFLQIN
jgi:hypothetical protein